MQNKFRNPALELMEKQERILRAYNNPALETRNYISNLYSQADRIYEIERIAQKMYPSQPLMDALDAYNRTIAISEIRDFSGIDKSMRELYKRLEVFNHTTRNIHYTATINDFSNYTLSHIKIRENINLFTESTLAALQPVIDNTFLRKNIHIHYVSQNFDSALAKSIEQLYNIAIDFSDETEQVFSEKPLDMFSEEATAISENDNKVPSAETIQEKLSSLTLSEKISYLLHVLDIFLKILVFIAAGSKLDVSVDYYKHTERVIVGDTIQETSDTDFDFDVSYGEQEPSENEDLIAYIESLSQQIDTLTEMVSELEKQEISNYGQCDCCDNS